jgi:hypothetical protein
MRKLVMSTLVCLACVAPVMAQEAQRAVSPVPDDLASPPSKQNQTPAPKQSQSQNQVPQQDQSENQMPTAQSIVDAVRTRLARAGYTNIEMVPMSFLVMAKDAEGNPVMLELSPNSVQEFKPGAPQDDDDDTAGTGTVPDQQKF